MADEQLTAEEIDTLLVALSTHVEANTPGVITKRNARLVDKLRNMRTSAPVAKHYVDAPEGINPTVCTRCGSVVMGNQWRMLHDEWHHAVGVDVVGP